MVKRGNCFSGNDEDLGSILYCDSLTLIDSRFFILTKSIPHYMGWFLSHKHHPSMDFNPEKVHFLKIKAIKKKIETYEGAWGFIPFSTQAIPQPEIPINAKLNLHEYGLVIIDKALGNIIIPFQHIDQFHLYVVNNFNSSNHPIREVAFSLGLKSRRRIFSLLPI